MNELIEIHFNKSGNTIIGSYAAYVPLDKALRAKGVFVPYGYGIKSDEICLRRLIDTVEVFGNCIKTRAAFKNACKLSDVDFAKICD